MAPPQRVYLVYTAHGSLIIVTIVLRRRYRVMQFIWRERARAAGGRLYLLGFETRRGDAIVLSDFCQGAEPSHRGYIRDERPSLGGFYCWSLLYTLVRNVDITIYVHYRAHISRLDHCVVYIIISVYRPDIVTLQHKHLPLSASQRSKMLLLITIIIGAYCWNIQL